MSEWVGHGLLGVLGGLIPEVMRVVASLRQNQRPSGLELTASALVGFLGLGVLLFDTHGDSRLEIAVLGASFPQLFSGLVAASTKNGRSRTRGGSSERGVKDYLAWRL